MSTICVVSVKSMTQALKVKKSLLEAYMDVEIIKLDANMTKKGCAYGVKFDCVNLYKVETYLDQNRIKYNQILNI